MKKKLPKNLELLYEIGIFQTIYVVKWSKKCVDDVSFLEDDVIYTFFSVLFGDFIWKLICAIIYKIFKMYFSGFGVGGDYAEKVEV